MAGLLSLARIPGQIKSKFKSLLQYPFSSERKISVLFLSYNSLTYTLFELAQLDNPGTEMCIYQTIGKLTCLTSGVLNAFRMFTT